MYMGRQMLNIICWNPKCPRGEFKWHEPVGCAPALPTELGTQNFSAACPYCTCLNIFSLKCVKIKPGGPPPRGAMPEFGTKIPIPIPIAMVKGTRSGDLGQLDR